MFTPEMVKKASIACEAICMWVRAMHKYHFVARGVEPKRKALAEAQASLDETLKILKVAQGELAEVVGRLQKLEDQFNEALGAGPGRRRLAAAWYFVYLLYILYIFAYMCIYFNIF